MREKFPLITDSTTNICVKLSQYRLIDVSGADAEKYLQGQLTCDVAKLAEGQQTLTCHCDPKGKMSALFRLFRQGTEQFLLLMPVDLLPEALIQLKKYAVFSKVTFTELDTPIYGTTSGQIFADFSEKATACRIDESHPRYLLWGDIQLNTNAEPKLWDLIDIQQGVPLLYKPNQFELIPQAANIQQIDQAISFTKGCYIGQETVARAKYRGANKRAMFTLVGQVTGTVALPELSSSVEMQLEEHWKSTGTILAAIQHQDQLWLQVVLNKDIEPTSQFRLGEVALSVYPLPYSLDENS